MENLSRVFQKQIRKKTQEEMSFITQFKIEFLRVFSAWKNACQPFQA